LAFDDRRVCQRACKNNEKPSPAFPWNPSNCPKHSARDNREIESGNDNQMVKAARLKLPFDFSRQAILSPKHHSGDQRFDGLVVGVYLKWRFDSGLNPFFEAVASMPPSVQNRDESGIPDRAGPIDTLSLQVAAVIKHPGILIDHRP